MTNIFLKHLCLSPFKCIPTSLPPPSSPPHHNQTLISTNPGSLSSDSSSSDIFDDTDFPPPNLSSLYTSTRFFFTSPGESNSILDSPEIPRPATILGSMAVQTDSPDPYLDFRKSMQEMVEAREYTDVAGDWDFLHELLSCYLMLNPKHTHKFIVGAFSDLLISLMSSTGDNHRKIDTCPKVGCSSNDSASCSSNGSVSAFSLGQGHTI